MVTLTSSTVVMNFSQCGIFYSGDVNLVGQTTFVWEGVRSGNDGPPLSTL